MPEKKRRKPGPAPTGRTVQPVGVALRPEDIEVLKRLWDEIAERQMAARGRTIGQLTGIEPRPSISAAIRYLIDAERKRRSAIAFDAWKELPDSLRPNDPDLLRLTFDRVFAVGGYREAATPSEKAYHQAYTERLKADLETQEKVTRLARPEQTLVDLLTGYQSVPQTSDQSITPKPAERKRRR